MPTGATCGAADDRRDLPVKVIARQVCKRPFSTDDGALPTTSPSNATHRRGTHAGHTTCGERLPFPASTARIRTTETVIASFSPATNPFLTAWSLPSAGHTGIRAVRPACEIDLHGCTTPTVDIREDLRRAHRESRDDRCSFPHHLPGITAKLLSLTLLQPTNERTTGRRRNFLQQPNPSDNHSPRLSQMCAVTTTRQTDDYWQDRPCSRPMFSIP